MSCDIFKPLLMGYLDDELTALEVSRVEQHLQDCRDCAAELEEFKKLKEVTRNMRVVMPGDKYWDEYWSNIYNRLERRVGWILTWVGTIILSAYAFWRIIDEAIFNFKLPLVVRVGLLVLIIGFCTLVVSVIRERLSLYKRDKYERIKR
jgi:predicted anti-sigma-YlaC factor YlaD